jgi:hypothetical protein
MHHDRRLPKARPGRVARRSFTTALSQTGREPLGSSGSRYPPVGKSSSPTGRFFMLETLVFAARPFSQLEVDSAQTAVQRRLVEMTAVVYPTPEVRILHSGQSTEGRVGPALESPLPDFPTHCLERSWGRRGQERDAIGSVGPDHKPRPEKYSRGDRTGLWDSVPCGWYPRSRRFFVFCGCSTNPQAAKPLRKSDAQGFGLGPSSAVADRVIRIPFKGNSGMGPCHPQVERVVQKQIR